MEIQEVSSKSLSIVEEANRVSVTNNKEYVLAGNLWKDIWNMKKQVKETFASIISKAHQAHKEAIAQKDKVYNPLDQAGRVVKKAMEEYDRKQEQARLEEERRLREKARKKEEERQLAMALKAEQNGNTEEADVIIEEPAYVPPVIVPKSTPKVQGGPVFRKVWKFRVVDPGKIPAKFMAPDQVKIGKYVRAMGESAKIPGVDIYQERV